MSYIFKSNPICSSICQGAVIATADHKGRSLPHEMWGKYQKQMRWCQILVLKFFNCNHVIIYFESLLSPVDGTNHYVIQKMLTICSNFKWGWAICKACLLSSQNLYCLFFLIYSHNKVDLCPTFLYQIEFAAQFFKQR